MHVIEEIFEKVKENDNKELFVIDGNSYYVINNYSELKDLNDKYNFIDIFNDKKEESQEKNVIIENLLYDKRFIINFDFDLKIMKEEIESPNYYSYIERCVFLGNMTNSVELEDDECFEGGLILDTCLVKGIVDFIFDPVYFEANGCKFLNIIDVHDLSDGFISSHSEFKDIYIETHHIENIDLNNCSGGILNINFDFYEPVFANFKMDYCDFKDVSINSNKNINKAINEIFMLSGCNFENLEIYKLYGKELIIDDTNIANIVISKSIINQEFMFTNQSFNTINLMGTYFTGRVLFDLGFIEDIDVYKTLKHNITAEEFIYNLEAFLRIAINQDNPEIKLKLKYQKDVQKNKIYNKGIHRVFNKMLDITTGYFTNYKRILKTMIGIIILFGIIYSILPQNIIIDGRSLHAATNNNYIYILYNSMYFSLITFSTIVYGNISPVGILKLFAGIEGLLGVLTTASLITVFARKFS